MNPDNARPIRITAAAGTYLAGAFCGTLVEVFPAESGLRRGRLRPARGVAASGLPHCANSTAASVGVWAVSQSQCGRSVSQPGYPSSAWWASARRLPDGPRPHPRREGFPARTCVLAGVPGDNPPFGGCPWAGAGRSRVTHPFAASCPPEAVSSFDLHVLGTPPAFILSQDQTLR